MRKLPNYQRNTAPKTETPKTETQETPLNICSQKAAIIACVIAFIALGIAIWSLIVAKDTLAIAKKTLAATKRIDESAGSIADEVVTIPWLVAGLRTEDNQLFAKEIIAKPGDIVEAQMYIRNNSGDQLKIGIGLTLSKGLTVVEDSAVLYSSQDGENRLGDIVGKTTNIGVYTPYDAKTDTGDAEGWAEVVFQIKVDEGVTVGERLEILSTASGYDMDDRLVTKTSAYYTYIVVVE